MSTKTLHRLEISAVSIMLIIVALPFVLYMFRAEYEGLIPFRTNDDGFYYSRVHTATLGRFDEIRNGITGGNPPARGAQPAVLELAVGSIGYVFGWNGPEVALVFIIIFAPLIIPLLVTLLRSIGVGHALALLSAIAYAVVFLSPLQRPVHMSWTLPLCVLSLLSLERMRQKPKPWLIIATGFLFGILPYNYFWSFTFAWACAAIMVGLHLFLIPPSPEKKKATNALFLAAGITILVSLPFIYDLVWSSLYDPIFSQTGERSQIFHTRWVESVPRSGLLFGLTVISSIAVWRMRLQSSKQLHTAILPLSLVIGAFVAMHQNVIHGLIFTFSSHYYPYVCLAALVMAAWIWGHQTRAWMRYGIACIAAVFLLAGLWDYRMAWSLLRATPEHLEQQHLRPALEILNDGSRETVLSDRITSQMVTGWTDDDVVFTPYVRHLIVSNTEFAERYCLSELPNPLGPDIDWIAGEMVQVHTTDQIDMWKDEFRGVCGDLLADPVAALKKYDVRWVLWDERKRPDWRMNAPYFERVDSGEGWSLWRIMTP